MVTNLENEMRIGAMIRRLSGEVRDAMKDQIYELYSDKKGNLSKCGESCARWHWLLLVYSSDLKKARKFIGFIQIAYEKNINLDVNKKWMLFMRMYLPEEAVKQIKGGAFTQVPKLSIINQTPLAHKNKRNQREQAIFRMY